MALQYGGSNVGVAALTDAEIARLASLYPCSPPAVAGTDRFDAWLVGAYITDQYATLAVDDQ